MNKKQIFTVSYPRSGSTWLRYLLTSLIHPEEELTVDNVDRLAPDIHEMHKWEELGVREPAVIKSHFMRHDKYADANIVYLYRDARDVITSYFLFTELFKEMSFSEFLEKHIHKGMQFGEWHKHTHYWMYESKGFYFIPLKYENLYTDPIGFLSQIINYLGFDFKDEKIKIIIPSKRIYYHKIIDDIKEKPTRPSFDSFYYCFKIDSLKHEDDIIYLD